MNIKSLEKLLDSPVAYIDRTFDKESKTVTWTIEGYKDRTQHHITIPYKLLTRKQAMSLTGNHEPKIRNYELEQELHDLDLGYFIQELCPFNGFMSIPEELKQ